MPPEDGRSGAHRAKMVWGTVLSVSASYLYFMAGKQLL
jgi:hypothetical protein